MAQPAGLTILAQANIDVLIVAHIRSGADGLPQSATARVISTQNGMLLAGVNWQNGLDSQSRPMTDQTMCKDLYEAASEIAGELTKQISPELMNGRQHILSTANLLDDLPEVRILSSRSPRRGLADPLAHEHAGIAGLLAAVGLDEAEPQVEGDVLGHQFVGVEA